MYVHTAARQCKRIHVLIEQTRCTLPMAKGTTHSIILKQQLMNCHHVLWRPMDGMTSSSHVSLEEWLLLSSLKPQPLFLHSILQQCFHSDASKVAEYPAALYDNRKSSIASWLVEWSCQVECRNLCVICEESCISRLCSNEAKKYACYRRHSSSSCCCHLYVRSRHASIPLQLWHCMTIKSKVRVEK